jgi:hypothetical protein
MFLKNVMIVNDTVFLDKDFDVDCRIDIPGYNIKSGIFYANGSPYKSIRDTDIIDLHTYTIQPETEFTVYVEFELTNKNESNIFKYKSKPFVIKVVENPGQRFIKQTCEEGRLKLSWPALDKQNTQYYIIQKYRDEKLIQSSSIVKDSFFVDSLYVGEELTYDISVYTQKMEKLNTWRFVKSREKPALKVEQNPVSGYTIRWTKNRYYNSLKDYTLVLSNSYTGDKVLKSNINVNDTSFDMPDALFGRELRLYLIKNPVSYPDLIADNQKDIYSDFLYSRFGVSSFDFSDMVVLNNNKIAYTRAGKIHQYDLLSKTKTDSVVIPNSFFDYLFATPSGKYIYTHERYQSQNFCLFWNADNFYKEPVLPFNTNFQLWTYSDQLTAVACIQNNVTNKYMLTYRDIQTDKLISEAELKYSINSLCLSPDGNYLMGSELNSSVYKLSENKWIKVNEDTGLSFVDFYSFDPTDAGKYYLYYNSTFYIRSLTDFSVIKSYPLKVSEIINIDFHSRLMLAYYNGNMLIINVDTGDIIKTVPADISELFMYDYKTILIGNTIYCSHGVKYVLN